MNPVWEIEALLVTLIVALPLGTWLAWRSAAMAAPRLRFALTLLRLAALIALAVIAFNPGSWVQPTREEERGWDILLDRSASMDVTDEGSETRWQQARRIARHLRDADPQPDRIRLHTFAARLERDARDDRRPDGEATDLHQALNDFLDAREQTQRIPEAIWVLSDGRQTTSPSGPDPALRARAAGIPIYAIATGGHAQRRDLAVSPTRRSFTGFTGVALRLQARIINHGFGAIRPDITLLDDAGLPLATQPVMIANDRETLVTFEVTPDTAGYREYEIVAPDWPGEASTGNNRVRLGVIALDQPIRILMVEGLPHWDSKFILQTLRAQPHLNVVTVHRVTGERFFLTESDAINEAGERTAFPSSEAAMNAYDLIIFGRGAEYFINAERYRLLRRFVEVHGGAVLFARGKPYHGTFPELATLEPVEWGSPVQRSFRWQPAAAIRALDAPLPDRDDPLWERLPPATAAHRPLRIKPFTQVLLEGVFVDNPDEPALPVLAVRRLGNGLTAVVNTDEQWRWDFFPDHEGAADFFKQFWTTITQWLAGQSDFLPGQSHAIRLSHAAAAPGTAVKATVRRRADFATTTNAPPPRLRALRDGRTERLWQLRPSSENPAEWTTIVSLDTPARYRIEVINADDPAAVMTFATLDITPPRDEQSDLSADPDYLRQLAERSGGRLLAPDDALAWAAQIRQQQTAIALADPVWKSHWDRAWIALTLASLLGLDWFLRRRNGMM